GPIIPSALAVINPLVPGSGYPFPRLTGAGIAFKIAWAMGQRLSAGERVSSEFRAFLVDAVALAAIGAIADVAPLLDENRILASYGVQALAATTRPGLRALCRVASLGSGAPRAWDVAFKLAPRLNAAGRLGCARRAVDLLTTTDAAQAEEIAQELDRENTARRAIQEQIVQDALAMIDANGGVQGRLGLVLAGDSWRQGVVGIVAGQLADRFARPTVVIAIEDGVGHGSARSGGFVNLHAAIEQCADLLISFGGHEHAAGLRVAPANIPAFAERFEQALASQITEASLAPSLRIDLEMPLDAATPALAREIARLEPFGAGNPEPVFASLGLRVASEPRRAGADGKHLSFWASQNGTGVRAIAFNQGPRADELRQAGVCSLAYCLRIDTYHGGRDVELEVKDIRLGAAV
ncbi:MAG TPA: DHHA1 domain-containing protein, partial [Candidatus Brocadiia bacterium]|nr:DHHA1 domain-containing protein [Candidatus Brocadiia bacterium]